MPIAHSFTLTDSEAKEILRRWPRVGTSLWDAPDPSGAWIRAQPVDPIDQRRGARGTAPRLRVPGAQMYRTQPACLWVYFRGYESCDLVVVEVCQSIQNLNDKRSRYMPATHATMLSLSRTWLDEQVRTRGAAYRQRRDLAGTFPSSAKDLVPSRAEVDVPIRNLRVLYVLANADYLTWAPRHPPSGSEFFIPHSSLNSYGSPAMQEFLRRMSVASQFYPYLPRLPLDEDDTSA